MKIECLKYTNDESWHPSYPRNTVCVSLFELTNGEHRVCVWGNDDFGMEQDFKIKGDAETTYWAICMTEFVNKDFLEELGFSIA